MNRRYVKTLRTRFAGFPVRIDMVSRFRTKAEQKQTLEGLKAGKVEIIVGTHRLLSKDVKFKDLGLAEHHGVEARGHPEQVPR